MSFALIKNLFHRAPLHPLLEAQRRLSAGIDHERPLPELDFVVLDAEMTGLDPRRDEIVSIGAVRIRNLRIRPADSFYTLVQPERNVSGDSTLIHRLTPATLDPAPALAEVLPQLLEFIGPAVLVGHHLSLDVGFLDAATRRLLGGRLEAPGIDTLRLAQIYEDRQRNRHADSLEYDFISFTLADLSRRYGLPSFPEHNAWSDAFQTAYLFLYLVKKLGGNTPLTLKGLWRASRVWWRR